MDAITPIPELVKYLSGREHNDSSRHFVEFDTWYTENVNDKNMPYLTRKYIKYFIKHGYVPQYFSPYDGVGDFTIAPTQATSSGSYTGMGAITIFRLDENIQWLMADQTAAPGLRAAEISKLRKAAEKPADTEATNKNREIGLIKFFVRKTTAEQIFEIMGIPAEYVEKCKAMGLSDAAIARLAGNGIVPGVVEASFRQLYGTVDHPGFLPEKD